MVEFIKKYDKQLIVLSAFGAIMGVIGFFHSFFDTKIDKAIFSFITIVLLSGLV